MSYNDMALGDKPDQLATTKEEYAVIVTTTKYINLLEKIKKYAFVGTKRSFDIICALVGCIFLIPISIIIKIAYMLNGDFGKIIYTQNRIGLHGKEFKLYKFRTMIPNADEVLAKMLAEDKKLEKEYKIKMKLDNDPRITKAGKFIRKSSIDELPQLINVLKNDMSLIGNRPYLPREKEDMGEYYSDIIKTKPAITGLWQVSGRSDTTFEKRLELESYYSNNYNIKIDFKIFINTFKVVLLHKGAE